MKMFIKIIAVIGLVTPAAHADGIKGRAFKAAVAASEKYLTPVISEMDVMKSLKLAQSRAEANHMSSEVDILSKKIPTSDRSVFGKEPYFRASIASRSVEAMTDGSRMSLVIDIKNLDTKSLRKIRGIIADGNWSNIGHFYPRIKTLNNEGDNLYIKIDIRHEQTSDLNQSFNHARGIKKLVDDIFKVALDANKVPTIQPTLSRAVAVGAR